MKRPAGIAALVVIAVVAASLFGISKPCAADTVYEPYDYYVFKDSGLIKAKNGKTGNVDYSNSDAYTVITSVMSAVSSGGTIKFGPGAFDIYGSIYIQKPVSWVGSGCLWQQGTTFVHHTDDAMINILYGCVRMSDFTCQGTGSGSNIHDNGIVVNAYGAPGQTASTVSIEHVMFLEHYNDFVISGSSWYSRMENCYFYSAMNACIISDSVTDMNWAFSGLVGYINHAVNFANIQGLNTVSFTDCSVCGVFSGDVCVLDRQNGGMNSFTGCLMENTTGGHRALYAKGADANRVRYCYLSNSYFGGGNASTNENVIQIDYGARIFISNCYITGDRGLYLNNKVDSLVLAGNLFETSPNSSGILASNSVLIEDITLNGNYFAQNASTNLLSFGNLGAGNFATSPHTSRNIAVGNSGTMVYPAGVTFSKSSNLP